MARIINQIFCVYAFLSNFHIALVPPPQDLSESDVDNYLNELSDNSINTSLPPYIVEIPAN